MCGIVGIIAKPTSGLSKQHEDSFFQMLYADALRGEDSTGVIGVENDSTFHIAKEAVSADWFIGQMKGEKETTKIVNAIYMRGKAWIGHNRKKTSGAIKDETAHPFVVDDTFAMVHNGTLYNHQELAKTEVDSEALAIHLHKAFDDAGEDKQKLKTNLEEALGKVYGAYAVAIYDQKRHCVHLLRNKDRPLCIIETDNAWYFCSEALMASWVLWRNNYKPDTLKAELIKEHQLVTFDLDTTRVLREDLDPKKSPTSHSVPGTRMAGKTTTPNSTKVLTEAKDLKRFRKNWLGKRVSFWTDDHLEKNWPNTVDENGETLVTIFGDLDEIGWTHTLLADVDMAALGLRFVEDLHSRKWTGLVEEITTTKSGVLQVWIKDAKPMVNSLHITDIQKNREWRDSLRKMMSEDLEVYYEENKAKLEGWQLGAINAEKTFRANITTVEQAAKVAKERHGCLLTQKQISGRFVYTDNEGNIYYESAIVVH